MKDDLTLQKDVEEELRSEQLLDASQIGVTARQGIITLTGIASSYAQKYIAEEAPKRVYGVTGIANDMEVRLPGDLRRSDTDIAASGVRALRDNCLVPDDRITVTVDKGWLTLSGTVDYHYQRNVAEVAVRDLPGVHSLTNSIAVVPRIKVSAHDVKREIYAAFHRNADLDARRVGIDVKGDTVCLHGNVHSWAERKEAVRAASATEGVAEVEDRLTITP